MDNQSEIRNPKSKICIVGAGPAGSSLAIRLAMAGFETTLIERERFPRAKLCGEFISPECFRHFDELGVREPMLDAGGDRIRETRFFERGGRNISVPTNWFGAGDFALSLSRAEMDNILLDRAREAGVRIFESTIVTKLEIVDGHCRSVTMRPENGEMRDVVADVFVDATGRAATLARLAEKVNAKASQSTKPAFVGFKAHVTGAAIDEGVCEIYSFRGGYAGLSNVEASRANLCFLVGSDAVRAHASDPNEIVYELVAQNRRAQVTLHEIQADEWLAVSIASFGTRSLSPAPNVFTVGDAAAFIDPFTGSGMVMALESSRLLAEAMSAKGSDFDSVDHDYSQSYSAIFTNRLRICSLLRRAGFMPRLATGVVSVLGLSSTSRRILARATRR